ncbi:MAG: RnfABCDGE type electron transport complex subunit D [Christensenellales bacterium]|jgi:electron transport complex protein RnfD
MNDFMITPSPHIRAKTTTTGIMFDVILAMLPSAVAAVYFFGWRAMTIMVLAVVSAVATEAAIQLLCKKRVLIGDLSAVVTGILIAFGLPVTVPLWVPVVGSVFAIAIVKQAFGGLGHNFMNPALAARAVLVASFPVIMTLFITPTLADTVTSATAEASNAYGIDALTGATPLALMSTGETADLPSLWRLFIGGVGGSLGETSKLAILIGAVYLFIKRVINPIIPVMFTVSTLLVVFLFGNKFDNYILYHLLTGALLLSAVFMATDYSSSARTIPGQFIFGIGAGLITGFIRCFGSYPEGVTYGILVMNVAAPLIDKLTKPRVYGEVRKSA